MAGITINSNIASLNAQRRLGTSTSGLRDAFARLSSGLRINKASDDAAGLAISSSLNVDRRVYDQGVKNLNDGISLLSIADGSLEQMESILTRLSELAEQSANGTLHNSQRKALDAEGQALKKEFLRISQTTRFNGLSLFASTLGNVKLQTGFGTNATLQSSLGGAVGTGSFQTAVTAQTGPSNTSTIASADFNGDGFADILSLGSVGGTGTLTIAFGDGQGGFSSVVTSAGMANVGSSAIAVGDINNDGILDVVATNSIRTVSLLGNGDGTFRAASTTNGVLFSAFNATLADINNDGFLDFSYTGGDDNDQATVVVSLGNGNGTFRAAGSYLHTLSTTDTGYTILYKDLNGDGKLDMFNTTDVGGNSGGYVYVRMGDGAGGFGAASQTQAFDFDGFHGGLADFNNDGILDWIQVGTLIDYGGTAMIALGNGNGTFRAPISADVGISNLGYSLAIGDFNGDGNMDFVSDQTVRLGNGDGTFGAYLTLSTGAAPLELLAIDADSNGVLDILSLRGSSAEILHRAQTTSGVSPILDFSLKTMADARQALPMFRQKLDQVTKQRGIVGAFQSRIETAISNTSTTSLNVASAASEITNADVAVEAANLVKQQILQRVSTAVLAQANQLPALALRLLDI